MSRLPGEQQAVPVLQRRLVQVQAGILREVRRAEQFAVGLVGPAMHRADDVLRVAAALQHDGLAVAADVAEQFHAVLVAHQHLRPAFQHVVVAQIRHHQFMADVIRPCSNSRRCSTSSTLGSKYQPSGGWTGSRVELIYVGDIGHALIREYGAREEGIVPEINWWGNNNVSHSARCAFSGRAPGSGRWPGHRCLFPGSYSQSDRLKCR